MSLNINQIYYESRSMDYMNSLRDYINKNYDVDIIDIQLAKRGYMAETYMVVSTKEKFFVKIVSLESHKKIYKESFNVIDFLNQNGINFIIKNIKTRNGDLTCDFENGVLGLFDFVECEHSDDYPLKILFEKYSSIYKVDTSNLNIKKEDFKASTIELFESNLSKIRKNRILYGDIINFFDSKVELIEIYKQKLRNIGNQCSVDLNNFHITHGDGQGNVMVCGDDITIIDWDTPLLSPIERDAWVFLDNQETLSEFNKIINKSGIAYTFKKERLYYYCYLYFFYYLSEELEIIMSLNDDTKISGVFEDIKNLFSTSNWLYKKMSIVNDNI